MCMISLWVQERISAVPDSDGDHTSTAVVRYGPPCWYPDGGRTSPPHAKHAGLSPGMTGTTRRDAWDSVIYTGTAFLSAVCE